MKISRKFAPLFSSHLNKALFYNKILNKKDTKMIKKNYETPEVEQIVIRIENTFMFSNGQGTASASAMNGSSWDSWDE